MEKVDIKSMDITELQELLQELGEPNFGRSSFSIGCTQSRWTALPK